MTDIDRFKDINDSLGHDHGDALLNQIARRFESEVSVHETLARLGGDEFIIVLPEHDQVQAEHGDQLCRSGSGAGHATSQRLTVSCNRAIVF